MSRGKSSGSSPWSTCSANSPTASNPKAKEKRDLKAWHAHTDGQSVPGSGRASVLSSLMANPLRGERERDRALTPSRPMLSQKLDTAAKLQKKKKSGDYSLLRPRGTCHPSMVPANITHAGCVTLSAEHQVRGDPHCLQLLLGSPGIRRRGLRRSGSWPERGATSVSAHAGILHSSSCQCAKVRGID